MTELGLLAGMPILPAIRTLAVVTGFPLLAGPGAPMHARLAVAAGLSFVLIPNTSMLPAEPLTLERFMLCAPFEFLIGTAIGYAFALVFHMLTVAGDFASQEMGLNAASQIDPTTGQNQNLLARLFEALGLIVFAEAGGIDSLLRLVRGSFDLLPPGALLDASRLGDNLVKASVLAIRIGLGLALPVALALFLITIFTTISARALPRLHIFDFAIALKLMIAIALVGLLLPRIAPGVAQMSAIVTDAVAYALVPK